MDNGNNSVADFLNGISDDNDIFAEKPADADKPVVEEEEKILPFHKDPKVQRYVDKQIEKALKDRPSVETQFKKDVEEINLPESFVELIGNDTPEKRRVLKDMSDYMSSIPKKAQEEFLQNQQEQLKQSAEADAKAAEELETYFEEIEETYGVDLSSNASTAKQTRAQFVEYVRKIAPKDANGEVTGFPDLVSAFETFQQLSQRTLQPSRAKELASRGMTRSSDTDSTAPVGKSWKDVDRFFETLKKNN